MRAMFCRMATINNHKLMQPQCSAASFWSTRRKPCSCIAWRRARIRTTSELITANDAQ
jgi:hypothetical protein